MPQALLALLALARGFAEKKAMSTIRFVGIQQRRTAVFLDQRHGKLCVRKALQRARERI